ncbi:hypothetical protein SAMN05444349_106112 [Bacteroides faecichinchillae]|uniref:Uncharacterized protein n=1 Tax=Bacteroides faecichinchillae TaxID=871325 RepID=A0A1M4WI93_9BACE|nr:hypothetical protein SAMN05444349_106112 [Bacteroides faecichinchillae]
MEENNLKEFWKEIHTNTEEKPVNIKEIIRKKHCNVISHTLHRQKILICLFTIFLIISVATSTLDTIIMERFSIRLWIPSAFLLYLLLSSIRHYQLYTKSADLYSITDSDMILKRQLKRKINVDFMIYLIYFYGMAIRLICMYFSSLDELKSMSLLLILFVGLLFIIP